MSSIRDFFLEIDQRWSPPVAAPGKIRLHLFGAGALMLQANYQRGTKDSDLFETAELIEPVKTQLLAIAGPGSDLFQRRKMYLDIVANGIPFLPQQPRWQSFPAFNQQLQHFELLVLEIVDVIVTKLKRFSPSDRSDIDAMINLDLVDADELVERFRAAVDHFSCDARADELPTYVANLHQVERDMLAVPESEIELPGWI